MNYMSDTTSVLWEAGTSFRGNLGSPSVYGGVRYLID